MKAAGLKYSTLSNLRAAPIDRDTADEEGMNDLLRGIVIGGLIFKGDGELIGGQEAQFGFYSRAMAGEIRQYRWHIIEALAGTIHRLVFYQFLAEIYADFRVMTFMIAINEIAELGFRLKHECCFILCPFINKILLIQRIY